MQEFKPIDLKSGEVVKAHILAKTITALVVRTEDNRYLLISRNHLTDESKYKFRN